MLLLPSVGGQNLPRWEPGPSWPPITVCLHLLSVYPPSVTNCGSKDEDPITSWEPHSLAHESGQQPAVYLTLSDASVTVKKWVDMIYVHVQMHVLQLLGNQF